jgi:hypothetical protein
MVVDLRLLLTAALVLPALGHPAAAPAALPLLALAPAMPALARLAGLSGLTLVGIPALLAPLLAPGEAPLAGLAGRPRLRLLLLTGTCLPRIARRRSLR